MARILIVEDEPVLSGTIVKVLSRKGLDVSVVGNGIEAIQIIKETLPEGLILDINLPGVSGLRVLEEAKKVSPDIKVIAMTAAPDSDTEEKIMGLGAHAFLKKPFIIEVLIRLLSEMGFLHE